MHEIADVQKKIEELRSELLVLVNRKGITDMEVIVASQVLDMVINEYYRLIRRQNTSVSG